MMAEHFVELFGEGFRHRLLLLLLLENTKQTMVVRVRLLLLLLWLWLLEVARRRVRGGRGARRCGE